MGTVTRFRNVVSANLNSMIEKAEDPEKLLRVVVRDMEDTLAEARGIAAQCLAEKKRIARHDPRRSPSWPKPLLEQSVTDKSRILARNLKRFYRVIDTGAMKPCRPRTPRTPLQAPCGACWSAPA